MITDFKCNTVCFSALLQGLAPVTYANMISVLDRYGIGYRLLPHTNDVWCRDYMPVQVADGVFRGFTYNPDYLQVSEELLATRTDGNVVCSEMGFEVKMLQQHFSDVYKLEYNVQKQHKYNWAYINWLQTDKVLMIPAFGCPEDEQAFDQIVSFMPMYKDRIEMVPATDLVRHEGCLNCASWTVRV